MRIGAIADSGYPLCPCPEETVAHHLFACPQDDLQTEYLPQKPDIANTLYQPNIETHTDTCICSYTTKNNGNTFDK